MITDKKYNVDNYIEDALTSKHQSKSDRMVRLTLDDGTVVIGKNRYDALKKIPTNKLLRSQKEQIKIFEDHHGITSYIEKSEQVLKSSVEKFEELEKRKKNAIKNINKNSVKSIFLNYYKKINGVSFKETSETLENIEPLILYFAKDEAFLSHGCKDEHGNFLSKPSLDKGICLIGANGNGKTSVMNTFQKMFIGLEGYAFGRFSSLEMVKMYEDASRHKHPEILENVWKLFLKGDLYVDDVKAEPTALAYGKKNLLNSVFQERYNKKLKTHISINFANGHKGNILQALLEFKTIYSNQLYDRAYEMYNFIEFKGKSFR